MGCLFEFIFEVVGEAILEGWMALMQLCIPRKGISPKVHNVLKVIVKVFSVILFLSIFFGIFLWLDTDALISRVGKYMVLIPLGISVFQIILGCIVRYIEKKK